MKERPSKGGADKDIWYRTKSVHNKVYNQDSNHQILGNSRTGKGTEKVQLVPKSGKNTKYNIDVETYAQQATRRRKEQEAARGPRRTPSSQNKGTSATLARAAEKRNRAAEKRNKEILKKSTDGIVNKTAGVIINGGNAAGRTVERGIRKIFDSKGPPAGSFMSTKSAPKKSGGKKATPKKDPPKRLPAPKGPKAKAKPKAKPAAKRISRGY